MENVSNGQQKQVHANRSRTVNDRRAQHDDEDDDDDDEEEAFQHEENLDLTNDFRVKFGFVRQRRISR